MPGEPDDGWPPAVVPMLATARPAPGSGAGYGWEWKYDGARAIARVRPDGAVRLDSRNARDFTTSFPEIAHALAAALPGRRLTVDGELVAMSPETGAPDFAQLQHRLGTVPSAELPAQVPVSYVVFNLMTPEATRTAVAAAHVVHLIGADHHDGEAGVEEGVDDLAVAAFDRDLTDAGAA